jgi:ABC transport system ATP-binding/permease protein
MIPGFGKQTITIGSAPSADIRLGGPGVLPEHARLVHRGGGQLVFENLSGPATASGQPVAPGASVPFDFRTQFAVGGTPVPLLHPAITLMLLERGTGPVNGGRLTLGRDPARVNIVVHHPQVSGLHASFSASPPSVIDHGSTSGTWSGQQKLAPEQARPLEPAGVVAVGPVPFQVSLLQQLTQALAGQTGVAQAVGVGSPAGGGSAGAPAPGGARPAHRTVVGQVTLGTQGAASSKSIGRTPDNDIQIEHAQVSSRHARLHKIGDQLFIEDIGSANGTFVRGHRIGKGERVPVAHGEKVFIGPMPLLLHVEKNDVAVVVEDVADWAGRPLYEIEAWDLVLQVPDRDNPKELKTLLDRVSFKAMPGDFIALMGPSGAGKTTLLLTLNGYLPPSGGQVRINGEDLYAIYDNLRGSIGYVPQDDIVHPELTVWEAVRYSAKFRLPPDYSEEEIDRRVQTTLQQLGLEAVAHLQIGRPEKKVLSGGQRKRVNIAMELVTDPVIMFLDEPTSGLAADDTTALVDLLHHLARGTGKTIIATIHQPAKDEFEKFNLALILGVGGVPIFYGPTQPDAYRFFGRFLESQGKANDVDNPRDMFDMLNQRERLLGKQNPALSRAEIRTATARQWNQEYFNQGNPTFQRMYSGDRAVGAGTKHQGFTQTRPKTKGQFGLLFSRYLRVKSRDVSGTAIMLAQAPIIGVLLALTFAGQKDAIPYWCLGALQELSRRAGETATGSTDYLNRMQTTPDHTGPIFFLVVAAVWFGTSNAAREIVSERAIYLRERMVNLRLPNYVFSKFILLSLICVIQCTILLAIVFFALGLNGGIVAFGISLVTMIVTAMNSVALGLVLSTVVMSSEAAMALTPIALIPQVVLGGLMVPMTTNPTLEIPMYVIPARWGFQGVIAQERLAILNDPAWVLDLDRPNVNSAPDFVTAGQFRCAEAQIASNSFNGAWGFVDYDVVWLPPAVLTAMMTGLLIIILIILKSRDPV